MSKLNALTKDDLLAESNKAKADAPQLGYGLLLLDMARADTDLSAKELHTISQMVSGVLKLQAHSHLQLLLVAEKLRHERATIQQAARIMCKYLSPCERRSLFAFLLRFMSTDKGQTRTERMIAKRIAKISRLNEKARFLRIACREAHKKAS